jgi:hypothetical protein
MPNNYILLETIALTQSAASVTFDNLPTSGYTDLKVVISARGDSASGFPETVNLRFNGSSASEYSWRGLFSVTATPGSNSDTSVTLIRAGSIPSVAQTANTFSNTEIYIPNYRSSSNKSVSIDATSESNSTTDFNYALIMNAGIRANTAAITAINLSLSAGNFVANSTFSLYGIAALGTTPVLAPKATGGNRIENDGTYWIHTFLTSGNFVPQTNLTCDVLVVAGGGGSGAGYTGNNRGSGGGGAGGYRTATGQSLTIQNYPVTIGAGGAGAPAGTSTAAGSKGANSVFNTLTSTGGGGGGWGEGAGTIGGSGGGSGDLGGAGAAGNQGGYSPVEGFAGGAGANSTGGGGGGGGSSAVGSAGTGASPSGIGGAGGAGTSNSYSGTAVTYAVGGKGGDSGPAAAGSNGTDSRGNGGGAPKSGTGTGIVGGNGGSGIVIIRYPIA